MAAVSGPAATIAAVATAPGRGAVAIVRISGDAAWSIVRALAPDLPERPDPHRATVRWLRDGGERLDQALVLPFVAPRSFTGEDVVELHCHGGPAVVGRVLDAVLARGARPAAPGEFTRRAVERGRLDLLQAEAIAALVEAQGDAARRLALDHLDGALSRHLQPLREALVELQVHVEAAIDFSLEEHVYTITGEEIAARAAPIRGGLQALLATWSEGRMRAEGVRVGLVGLPNAGKSTLLNHLLGEERALVTDEPGTTRDWLEEGLQLDGVAYRVVDTAGLRETTDRVEALGVERARGRAAACDVLLVVVDAALPGDWWSEVSELVASRPWGLVWNKVDVVGARVAPPVVDLGGVGEVSCSLRTGEGTAGLRSLLRVLGERAGLRGEGGEGVVITRARHRVALQDALDALGRAVDAACSEVALECVALDLRLALDAVGSLTGAVTSEEILQRIFGSFCVGK